jgi:acyl-CoA synthetase (AMP-forming)/AMP-acid ligase II
MKRYATTAGKKLAPYKVPVRVEFRKELPKTMVGKVLRRVLAQEERANLAQHRKHGPPVPGGSCQKGYLPILIV